MEDCVVMNGFKKDKAIREDSRIIRYMGEKVR
jgi:hypothetical protein